MVGQKRRYSTGSIQSFFPGPSFKKTTSDNSDSSFFDLEKNDVFQSTTTSSSTTSSISSPTSSSLNMSLDSGLKNISRTNKTTKMRKIDEDLEIDELIGLAEDLSDEFPDDDSEALGDNDVKIENTDAKKKENDSLVPFSFSDDIHETYTAEEKQMSGMDRRGIGKYERNTWTTVQYMEKSREIKKQDTRFRFLKTMKDKQGRLPDDPMYDKKTLLISDRDYLEMTPFERQYWKIKSDHLDKIVFFKKGKFYELYELDADIGREKLDLHMTDRVNMRMVGVPQSKLDYWGNKLLRMGYSIVRVDEMDTSRSLARKQKNLSNFMKEKIIDRQITRIVTPGTIVDEVFLHGHQHSFLLVLKQCSITTITDNNTKTLSFGFCLMDASTGLFRLGKIDDDLNLTCLETLLVQHNPKEVLLCQNNLDNKTIRLVKRLCCFATVKFLIPDSEFISAEMSLDRIQAKKYFPDKESYPNILKQYMESDLVMSCLGTCLNYLSLAKLDKELLSFQNFESYDPISPSECMVLDGQAIQNLEIFANSIDGGKEGTLWEKIDNCSTSFGRRLLRRWVFRPLLDARAIIKRQNIVSFLINNPEVICRLQETLRKLPDLERLLSRIHAGATNAKGFLLVLNSFEKCQELINFLNGKICDIDENEEKEAIGDNIGKKDIISLISGYPDSYSLITELRKEFDGKIAETHGKIIPLYGISTEYDSLCETRDIIKEQLELHLTEQKKLFKCSKVCYRDIGKTILQLEVPVDSAKRLFKEMPSIQSKYVEKSCTNQVKRLYTPKLQILIPKYLEVNDLIEESLSSFLGVLLSKFSLNMPRYWQKSIDIIASIDALISLGITSVSFSDPSCIPTFSEHNDHDVNYLETFEVRHPCFESSPNFVSNNLSLSSKSYNHIILTGPNMGGKSTFLRCVASCIVLAQIGCHVPASKFQLSPVDRIFTRLGASDNIVAGRSTFMVELMETASVLRLATPKSFVILDELGRGTSTHDGYALAYSVVKYLSEYISCRCLFTTHYHLLTDECKNFRGVALMHMDATVGKHKRDVVFLYRLKKGVCPKSYGMNVALMAGIPLHIVEKAEIEAENFESRHTTSSLGLKELNKEFLYWFNNISN